MAERALVLDVDDTLVATFRVGLRKCRAVAARLRLAEPEEDELAAVYGAVPFEDCVRRLHPGVDLDRYRQEYDSLIDAYPAEPLCDGAALIAAARDSGFKVGVLTNGPGAKTTRKLAAVGVRAGDLDFVVHGDAGAVRKPAVAAFEQLARFAGLDPSRSWYVSDLAIDWEGSEAAGFGSIGVLSPHRGGFGRLPRLLVPDAASLVEVLPAVGGLGELGGLGAGTKAVSFDAGFTLVEQVDGPEVIVARYLAGEGTPRSVDEACAALAMAAPRLPPSEELWAGDDTATSHLEAFYRTVMAAMGLDDPQAARAVLATYTDPSNWRPVAGAAAVLEMLRRAGWPVGVLANWQSTLPEVLTATGLDSGIDQVVASAAVGAAKPSLTAFAAVADALGVSCGTLLHAGDDVVADVAGALLAGCRAMFVPRGSPGVLGRMMAVFASQA